MPTPLVPALQLRAPYLVAPLVAAALVLLAAAGARACVSDAECTDGLVCNGTETCDLETNTCEPGTPAPDGAQCDAGTTITCTLIDTCQGGVCTPGGGGDTDGDDVCEAEDNCPGLANPGQEDFDEDDVGNICDAADGSMEVVQAKLKFDKSQPGRRPNGRIVLKSEFLTDPPLDVFDPTPGLLLRVQDSLGLDELFAWLPGECVIRTNQAGEVRAVKCRSADNRYKAKLNPHRQFPAIVRVRIILKQLPKEVVPGPFFGPVTVTLAAAPPVLTTGVDRVGDIVDCQQVGSGMKCKE
jgi:hypothetical protein